MRGKKRLIRGLLHSAARGHLPRKSPIRLVRVQEGLSLWWLGTAAMAVARVEPTTRLHDIGVDLDAKGFVLTHDGFATSIAGLFAGGDVRADSVKRVASAVGEGSTVISAVHAYLASRRTF
jgi:NADPH-dependent glutamate synthase beta subunit-like oxidoreductase